MVVEHAQHQRKRQRPVDEQRAVSVLRPRVLRIEVDGVSIVGKCREVEEVCWCWGDCCGMRGCVGVFDKPPFGYIPRLISRFRFAHKD